MTPSTAPMGVLRNLGIANAVVGVASARAVQMAQERIEWLGIFFTLTVELRPCWQALARRVNDTRSAQVPPWGGCRGGVAGGGRRDHRVGKDPSFANFPVPTGSSAIAITVRGPATRAPPSRRLWRGARSPSAERGW